MDTILKHCENACQSASLVSKPFPHYIIDNFLPAETFSNLVESGLAEKALLKRRFETSLEFGKTVHGNDEMNEISNIPIKILGGDFGSKLISRLFSIQDVTSMFDRPNFGGYYPFHQMSIGGWLGSHVDHSFSSDGQTHIANCIFYANPIWQDEWGGDTILFDKTGIHEIKRVQPKPNRLLVFLHSSTAFHGVETLKCPSNTKRMSYYMDYYTNNDNAKRAYKHEANESDHGVMHSWKHGTVFLPFCPLGKIRLPRRINIKQIKKEVTYLAHYLAYLNKRFFTKK